LVSVEAHLCDLEDRLNERGIFSGNPMTDSPAREGDGAHDQTLKSATSHNLRQPSIGT